MRPHQLLTILSANNWGGRVGDANLIDFITARRT
jgi:hypothetical protein